MNISSYASKMSHRPSNFQSIYDAVIIMRRELIAPVDVAGCHVFGNGEDVEMRRFHILIALLLSPMTRDQVVAKAMKSIEDNIGCNIIALSRATREDIEPVIKEVNVYQKKANYIKESVIMIQDKYGGKIPSDMKSLLALPGVGPKIAGLFMNKADNATESIAVDTHLSRIFQRWGWTNRSTPTAIASQVQEWLPAPLWKDINQIVVGFGQVVCSANNPLCNHCLAKRSCPDYASRTQSITTTEEVATRGEMADIEDIASLRKETRTARDKLIEEHGLPEEESVWIDSQGRPMETHWK